MKRIYFFISTVLLLSASVSFAAEIIPSEIKEVTLFSNQALVTREAFQVIQQGFQELLLEVDAFRVDEDSVSAKVFGEGEILSVQFKEIATTESPQENIRSLERKIKDLKQSNRKLMDEKSVLNKQEQFLDALIRFSEVQIPKDMQTRFPESKDLNQTLDFLTSGFQKINGQKQSIEPLIEVKNEEIKILEEELAALRKGDKKTKKVIEILFDSRKQQKIKIQASYISQDALWHPLYKVSVPLTLDEADLTMFSKILQKTGEDWKKIGLSVSNVIPLKGIRLPLLSTWILDIPRPRTQTFQSAERLGFGKKAVRSAPTAGGDEIETDFQITEEAAEFAPARRKELGFSFEYQIPHPVDIESRDKETILPLFSKKVKGEFFYYSVPKRSNLIYLVCKASADKELLSGLLNVYFGNRFIGKTALEEKKAGEAFYVNLGADREIKVKREKITDKVKETFFGKLERDTLIRELEFKITVENIKDKPIRIKLLDALPVSGTDKIEIKDVKITPEPNEKDYQNKKGVMLWDLKLAPSEKKEIDIAFVVSYPKEFPLTGIY
ncbi:MAG: mucoidy inhibitor MuiA family protein [Desulfobacterales bacterium]|nr:mucoidy inhibitor MuiA family protein [Desulfobacterales bacterium]